MSKSKTFEAPTIEEALVAAAREFGPAVEVADAKKRRRGGLFGFFAKEYFEVTALGPEVPSPTAAPSPDPTDFARVLQQMAADVTDTVDLTHAAQPSAPTVDPVPPADGSAPVPRSDAGAEVPAAPPLGRRPRSAASSQQALADRAVGLIDLRHGRRIPVDPLVETDALGVTVRERPSKLRRRLTAGATGSAGPNPLTRQVSGPILDLRDGRPEWSIERLRRLGLGDRVVELVAAFEPESDLEWVQALATAIQVQMPDHVSGDDMMLAGEGRASAVGLVQALADGRVPAFLLIDGHKIPATADELALSIRECLR